MTSGDLLPSFDGISLGGRVLVDGNMAHSQYLLIVLEVAFVRGYVHVRRLREGMN